MKIIFLNINILFKAKELEDETTILKLKNISESTNASIVLFSDISMSKDIKNFIIKGFEALKFFVFDFIPNSTMKTCKKIEDWLNKHRNLSIENFIILDDKDDIAPFSSKLIWINSEFGLTWNNVTDSIDKLQEKNAYFMIEFYFVDGEKFIKRKEEIFKSEVDIYEYLDKKNLLLEGTIQLVFYPSEYGYGENLYRGYAIVEQR